MELRDALLRASALRATQRQRALRALQCPSAWPCEDDAEASDAARALSGRREPPGFAIGEALVVTVERAPATQASLWVIGMPTSDALPTGADGQRVRMAAHRAIETTLRVLPSQLLRLDGVGAGAQRFATRIDQGASPVWPEAIDGRSMGGAMLLALASEVTREAVAREVAASVDVTDLGALGPVDEATLRLKLEVLRHYALGVRRVLVHHTQALAAEALARGCFTIVPVRAPRDVLRAGFSGAWCEAWLTDPDDPAPPYQGLTAYGESDARRYFGRDLAVTEAFARLSEHRVLLVAAPSGAGKSSFLQAGLRPRLRKFVGTQGRSLGVAVVRPGTAPSAALAEALGMATLASASKALLIVVDPLEEIATASAPERAAFLTTLGALVAAPPEGVYVLIGLRLDRLALVADDPVLGTLRNRGAAYDLPPLAADDVRAIVREPLRGRGVEPDPELVETIVRDMAGAPSHLPLLSHVLERLWSEHAGRALDAEAYRRMNGVAGALDQYADHVWRAGTAAERGSRARLLLRLVDVHVTPAGMAVSRRRERMRALAEVAGSEAAAEAATAPLIERRLLVADGSGEARTVELAHEALLVHWGTLAALVDQHREALALRTELATQAARWDGTGRRSEHWTDHSDRLRVAEALSGAGALDLSALERAFLVASRRRVQRGRWLARAGVAVLAAALAVVIVFFLRAEDARDEADAARDEANAARDQANLARDQASVARDDSAAARDAAQRERDRAALLAVEGRLETSRTLAAIPGRERDALVEAIGAATTPGVPAAGARAALLGAVSAAEISLPFGAPPGPSSYTDPVTTLFVVDKILYAARATGPIDAWRIADRHYLYRLSGHPRLPFGPHRLGGVDPGVTQLVAGPDGTVVTAGRDGTVRAWSAATGALLVKRGGAPERYFAALSADGGTAFVPIGSGGAVLDMATGAVRFTVSNLDAGTEGVFAADGKHLLVSSLAGTRVLDAQDGRVVASHQAPFDLMTAKACGHRVFAQSKDGIASIDVDSGRVDATIDVPAGVAAFAVAHACDRVALADKAGGVSLWDADGRRRADFVRTGDPVLFVRFVGSTLVATGGDDRRVRVWAADGGLLATDEGHAGAVADLIELPESRLATASADGTVRNWGPGLGPVARYLEWDGETPPPSSENLARRLVIDARFTPDGGAATVRVDGAIDLWATDGTHRRRVPPPALGAEVLAGQRFTPLAPEALAGRRAVTFASEFVALAPNGLRAAFRRGPNVLVVDVEDGTLLATLAGDLAPVNVVAFAPDGRHLVSGDAEGHVRLWDLASPATPLEIATLGAGVTSAGISANGATGFGAAFGARGRADREGPPSAVTFSANDGLLFHAYFAQQRDWVNAVLAPEGLAIAQTGAWGTHVASAIGALENVHRLADAGIVQALGYAPDGQRIATAGKDPTVRLWSRGGELQATLVGHAGPVRGLDWSAQGLLLTVGDQTVRLWDPLTKRDAGIVRARGEPIVARFSPDGRHVLASWTTGVVALYPVALDALVDRACALLQDHPSPVSGCPQPP